MRIIAESILFIAYLTVSYAQSGEIASRVDNYWQRRINMELSQDRYQPPFEQPALPLALKRRTEYDLPPLELPALPSIDKPPVPSYPSFEPPPLPPFPSFEKPPFPPLLPFEQPPVPVFEQSLEEKETPHLDMPIQPDDVSRRQGIYDPLFHLSRRQGNLQPRQPYGSNSRHNFAHNGAGISYEKEMMKPYTPRHYPPNMQYPSNGGHCNQLSSPMNNLVHPPVLSPCEMLCGTQRNGYKSPMVPGYATGSSHGMGSMRMAAA